jgi:mRNA interferase RelE/StbE
MQLIISPKAIGQLSSLPTKDREALIDKLKQVAANPQGQYPWAMRLTNHPGFRIRHGDWRAIYSLDFDADQMVVAMVAKREDAYR